MIPKELVELLSYVVVAGVTWLVVAGFKGLGEAFGKDFSSVSKVIAAIVSAAAVSAVIGVSEALVGMIPVEYAPVVNQFLALLVVAFSAMGIQRESRKGSGY